MSHRAKPSANPRPAGIEAIRTTLQKTAIHRDRRDRRRATYFPMIRLKNPNHLHSTAGDATRSPAQITDFHHLPRFWPYTVPAVLDAEDQRPSASKPAGTGSGARDWKLSRNPRNARCLPRGLPSDSHSPT